MNMKKHLLPIMVIAWSIYYILCDMLIDVLESPYFVGFLIRTITFVGLTVFMLASKKMKFNIREPKSFFVVIATAILVFVFDCLINVGLQHSSAASGTALLKIEMVFVLILNGALSNRKISARDGVVALSMAVGSFLIVLGDVRTWGVDWWSLLFILSAMLNSVCAFLIKKTQEKYEISSYKIVYINNMVSWLLYFCLAFVFEGSVFFNVTELYNSNLWLIGILCSICQMALMLTYYQALAKYQVWIVKASLLLIPIITLFVNVLFSSESITLVQIVGIGVTLTSAFVLTIRGENNSRAYSKDKSV